jgi:predicted alpha/beta superfamily hydrolase
MRRQIAVVLLTSAIIGLPVFANEHAGSVSRTPFSIGETVVFQSDVLGEDRIINVYLPAGYAEHPEKTFPVIYLLDGSADEDFIHIAGLVQFASFSWIEMIPETIVVGIANVDRQRDLTFPSNNEKDRTDLPSSGGSARFIEFIADELQPLIGKSYRTDSTKTLIGQSLGALLATEILFKKPDLFENYVVISPSLWWDDGSLLEITPKIYSSAKSIYVGVGREGDVMERAARALSEKIDDTKSVSTRTYFGYFEALDHGDTLHLAVYDAFSKMFGVPVDSPE